MVLGSGFPSAILQLSGLGACLSQAVCLTLLRFALPHPSLLPHGCPCLHADDDGNIEVLQVADHFNAHECGVAAVNMFTASTGTTMMCSLGRDGTLKLWNAP